VLRSLPPIPAQRRRKRNPKFVKEKEFFVAEQSSASCISASSRSSGSTTPTAPSNQIRKGTSLSLSPCPGVSPNPPPPPSLCRWIPLKQRSYSKRGRKNRNKFVGGQGSGDGAQKDMQKLDAYARSHGAEAAGNKKQGVVIAAPTATGGKKGRKKR
jgi:hypothetical protein